MATAGDGDDDAVLSDVEADEPPSLILNAQYANEKTVSPDRYRQVVAELERERAARQAVEASKSDLQVSFNRLKVLAHEAIKKRDEAIRDKEEALRSNENLSGDLSEATRLKDEALRQRDEIARQVEEAVKARESSRSEIESSAQLLVKGIDKISGKVASYKNFSGGLPRSQKFTGLSAVAYGVIKRTNEIVDELLKQIETANKSRNEVRENMEQRNYEIAIEVSELEATISRLREDLANRTSQAENWEKSAAEKDEKMLEMEKELHQKLALVDKDVEESHDRLRALVSKLDLQKPLIIDQLSYVSKAHNQLCEIFKVVNANYTVDQLDVTESLFLPNDTDMEENLRTSLTGIISIDELGKLILERVSNGIEERNREVKVLNETIEQLVKEKQHIGSLLRSALSNKITSDPSTKTNEILQVAETGLREAGLDVRFDDFLANGDKPGSQMTEEDEVYTLAGALEKIVKASQVEIIELQHTVEALRAESSLLRGHLEAQAKEVGQKRQYIKELEEKERVANESVEGLMMDIVAAEEEIARWKLAAEQEAAAGRAVEQEFIAQLSTLRQELEEAKQKMLESENKLKFKEETAVAAMAARDAAEKSLKLADLRASRLRERVEELSRQIEESDTREDMGTHNRPRYVCWPWQWLGLNFVGHHPETRQNSNEMELSEPLL
ncbi:hypothetical protein H6P81_013404 [Aristolochia fimbriata]|uniref:Paramyosin n=1 Tax=Aristolochia fimbriata TaxID=158543 RepID=A0AAV7EFT5_ARIFI|nr:hypothetical protein H6P81_013404 [Aristolochia fimbriata]